MVRYICEGSFYFDKKITSSPVHLINFLSVIFFQNRLNALKSVARAELL